MAEAAVTFVLQKIGEAAYQEALVLYGARDKVVWAKGELEWIGAFLKDADAKANQNLDNRVKQWVKNVKEVAYMIEDALDKFLIEVNGVTGKLGVVKKICYVPKRLVARHRVNKEIDEIKERLVEIKESVVKYGIEKLGDGGSTVSGIGNKVVSLPILPDIDETEVLGFETDMNRIIQQLTDKSNSKRSVISIVGTGGLGKTTLAKLVYRSANVKNNFGYCMWLTISKEYDLADILKRMLKQIHGNDSDVQRMKEIREMELEDLVRAIHEFLVGKTYLIVLDDIWSTALWTELQKVLPDVKNGSRALITTRSKEIAQDADCSIIPYELQVLSKEKSLELMLGKAFPNQFANECPEGLLDLADQFANRCSGLPLALVVMGRILSKKHPEFNTWSELLGKIKWHTDGKECMEIVSSSYDELPLHMKSCFMYFAMFPEDCEIKASSLLRLWIAEGFIPQEEIMEDTAEIYLEDLAQRCMVQVIERSYRGKIKSCHVHDILHELAIHKAQEDNFIMVVSNSNNNPTSSSGPSARRIALQFSDHDEDIIPAAGRSGGYPNLRSFVYFGSCFPNCNELRMARIVKLYCPPGVVPDYKSFEGNKHLTALRYFQIGNGLSAPTRKILPQLAHSKFLQTLETSFLLLPPSPGNSSQNNYCAKIPCFPCVKNNIPDTNTVVTRVYEQPSSFWNNKMLRHFIWSDLPIPGPPSSARLDNLLTLKVVLAREGWSVRLPHFPRIRKLGIFIWEDFDWEAMTNLMSNDLEHLRSLSLYSGNMSSMKDPCVTPAFKNFRHMYKLSLSCIWPENAIIDASIFPSSLVKLSLSWSEITQDPMPELGKLQCLKILFLEENPYLGEKMVWSAGGFKCLQQLRFFRLHNLKEIEIENGAMPMLNRLSLQWISEMNVVPDLQYLINLCEFTYFRMSDEFCTRLKGADQHKVQHIASVEAY